MNLEDKIVSNRLVVRFWKRDGSKNIMDIGEAAANVASNGRVSGGKTIPIGQAKARAMLMSGDTVSTKLAMFRLLATY